MENMQREDVLDLFTRYGVNAGRKLVNVELTLQDWMANGRIDELNKNIKSGTVSLYSEANSLMYS